MADDYHDNRAPDEAIAEQDAIIIITKNFNSNTSSNDVFFGNGSDSGNESSWEPYDVPTGLICLLAFLYGSISMLTVIGNGLVILVIVKNMRMHTVTNIFISNLAVADVIIGLFSIPFQFQAALLQRWVLANFMCSLAPFVQVISVNVSIFTLTVIAADRYIAVIHPFKAGCSKKAAAIIISVIWTVGIGTAVPEQQYYWVDYIPVRNGFISKCSLHSPDRWLEFPLYYNILLICMQYPLPLVVITFCYCRIAWHIWGSRRPGDHVSIEDVRGRNKRKVGLMCVVAVVCVLL
ncbi:hypothetical protein BsWGS_08816 [Bradybaena similaris]